MLGINAGERAGRVVAARALIGGEKLLRPACGLRGRNHVIEAPARPCRAPGPARNDLRLAKTELGKRLTNIGACSASDAPGDCRAETLCMSSIIADVSANAPAPALALGGSMYAVLE